MAKSYQEGAGWAFRMRIRGEDIYRSGFKNKTEAMRAMEALKAELCDAPAQSGRGAHRTSVGAAFSDYAKERLPYLKGASQDVRRINRYLRALGLPVVELTPVTLVKEGKRVFWDVTFVEEPVRVIPASLTAHRHRLGKGSAESDRARKQLAGMMMADVTTHHVQAVINALRAEGKKSATIHLERSELRRLFKHASAVWKWRGLGGNPADAEVDMPAVEAGRDRVVTNEEWQKVSKHLAAYPNPYAAPLACLMLETAMRSCEPLVHLRWGDIDWRQRVIKLRDAKAGARKVPLGPGALHVLSQLKKYAATPPLPDDKVFPTTYEAVKKAWAVSCKKAGLTDVGLHDLRHTSATRFALEFKGNLPVLMVITGHKTAQMAMRYVNIEATQVATMMHKEPLPVEHTAAGYEMDVTAAMDAAFEAREQAEREKSRKPFSREPQAPVGAMGWGDARVADIISAPRPAAGARSGNIIPFDFRRRAA
ncbi:site-specific integrase [Zoogloea sp. 1C4]|uniref:tyrosine-type recombinase/integrase n=1 Tax=Zoogloea sp. 1C4 TaxID=2570190 RepID=UPI001884EAD4|nr:site-specific integrase [Zoogloea sp. 1C4]